MKELKEQLFRKNIGGSPWFQMKCFIALHCIKMRFQWYFVFTDFSGISSGYIFSQHKFAALR